MRVDGNISDLFFNAEHEHLGEDYSDLRNEAKDFLDCLYRLGVAIPTVDDLVQDFYDRL